MQTYRLKYRLEDGRTGCHFVGAGSAQKAREALRAILGDVDIIDTAAERASRYAPHRIARARP